MSLWKLLTAAYNSSGDSAKLRADASTSSLQVVTYEHHEIHSGSHFHLDNVQDLALNSVYDIQITTPNTTKWTHLTFEMQCENETEWWLYENVNIILPGSASNVQNNNRNSVTVSGMTVNGISNSSLADANADTAVAGATILHHGIIGAGQTGGDFKRTSETILKQNTSYSLRFLANTAGFVDYNLEWYEHADHN